MLVKRSVTSRLGRTLAAIVILFILSTSIALFTVASSLRDAEAINIAGSLRMQSYRLAHDLTHHPEDVTRHLDEYKQSLQAIALKNLDRFYVPNDLRIKYHQLLNTSELLERQLILSNTQGYLDEVAHYVAEIDHFVLMLQHYSENKMAQVVTISLVGLMAIITLVSLALRTTRREVVIPLNKLVNASLQLQKGYFSPLELDVNLPNEMGELSKTFTRMGKELEKLYRSLAEKVAEKTASLTQANQNLSVLFDCSQALAASLITQSSFEQVLSIVLNSEKLGYLQLEICDNEQDNGLLCVGHYDEQPPTHSIPLCLDGQLLGKLRWPATQSPHPKLMQNVANMISRSIYFNQTQKQQRQWLLMEERAAIARELHDSLAQTLAFLQIKVTLLKKAIPFGEKPTQLIIQDLSHVLKGANQQLRELLTTFRLTIQSADLHEALKQLLDPLKRQTTAHITLHCQLSSHKLNAQQQIHVLQIIREATLNAIKHAQATQITIHCFYDNKGENVVSITDNGIGIPTLEEPSGHHGLTIMHERATRLEGTLSIQTHNPMGTQIILTF